MTHIYNAFHNQPLVKVKDRNFIVNPLIDHEPSTPFDLMNEVVVELSKLTDFSLADAIIGEEDRGGYIAALMAFHNKKSLAMVKWNPNGLDGQIGIEFRNAYAEGKMYLNGVKTGDKVILVEDLIDSGGTIISMLKALKIAGVEVLDVICVAEKVEYNGIEKIKAETGFEAKVLLKVASQNLDKSQVVWSRED